MSSPEDAVLVRHHLPTEALAAIKSLSDGEKAALLKVAKVLCPDAADAVWS